MFIVSISGNIGVGKSTILEVLKSLGHKVIMEGINRGAWSSLLQEYYRNPKRCSFHFQTVVLIDIYNQIRKAKTNKVIQKYDFLFTERSCIDCFAFASVAHVQGNLSDLEFETFKNIYKKFSLVPHIVITLQLDTITCLRRIRNRGRPCEENIDIQYLDLVESETKKSLRQQTEQCLPLIKNIFVKCYNRDVDSIVEEILSKIKKLNL